MSGQQHQEFLPPRVLQAAGLVLLFASAIFWAISGSESALLVGAALSLIGLGSYSQATSTLRKESDEEDTKP